MASKNKTLCFTFFLILLAAIGCGKNESSSESFKNVNDTIATRQASAQQFDLSEIQFIELGSVNCIPCKMMQPVMEKVKTSYKEKVKVVFHDVWTEQGRRYGEMYSIRAIPTQVFLDKNGNEFFRHTGFYSFEEIEKMMASFGITK